MNSIKGEKTKGPNVYTFRMKTIVDMQYGSPDVIQLDEIERPSPKDNEVLVTLPAVAVTAADWQLLHANPFLVRLQFGLFKPKHNILGADAVPAPWQTTNMPYPQLAGMG